MGIRNSPCSNCSEGKRKNPRCIKICEYHKERFGLNFIGKTMDEMREICKDIKLSIHILHEWWGLSPHDRCMWTTLGFEFGKQNDFYIDYNKKNVSISKAEKYDCPIFIYKFNRKTRNPEVNKVYNYDNTIR